MFKVVDLHNQTMMQIEKLEIKNGAIATKGKMMGTMPGTFYMHPEELWGMVKMLSFSLIINMPVLLVKGMWRSWTGKKKIKTAAKA